MWRHKTSVQKWGWKEVKDLQVGRTESRMRYLKGVETHSEPPFQQILTHILSLDLLTPPHSFCLSCSTSSHAPLTSSLNNGIACMALQVFSPDRISQASHRLERTHGKEWQRLAESRSFPNKTFPLSHHSLALIILSDVYIHKWPRCDSEKWVQWAQSGSGANAGSPLRSSHAETVRASGRYVSMSWFHCAPLPPARRRGRANKSVASRAGTHEPSHRTPVQYIMCLF